ncbi:MAG TPA: SURF1 family protein [Stenotrophomonas sp.]|nr:SURF1 family protein [Stenotrophomonas sp.]
MMRQHTRLLGWVLALTVAAAFALLGRWQLQRMHDKQVLLQQASQVRQHPRSLDAALARDETLQWASGSVELQPQQILLDNQMREGRAGVRIYQPARSEGGRWLLVDLGWWPLPPDRQLPVLTPIAGRQQVSGLLAPPPSSGLRLGPALSPTTQTSTWLATRIDTPAIGRALGRRDISSQVLRLDPALPLGYARDLDILPNTLPPARHLAYAVQWFGLALAVLATAVLLEWRRRRERRQARIAAP